MGKQKLIVVFCVAEKLHLIEYFDEIRLSNKKSEFVNIVDIKISYYLKY